MKSLLRNKDLKYLPVLLAVLLIGIAFLASWSEEENNKSPIGLEQPEKDLDQNQPVRPAGNLETVELSLEQRLENILSQIKGVGQVKVTVLLASGPRYDYAVNVSTTEKKIDEKDQNGGLRTTTEVTEDGQLVIIRSDRAGGEEPIIAQEFKPNIQGVLVVAEGAKYPKVKANLLEAVTTILDIDPHKVDIQTKE